MRKGSILLLLVLAGCASQNAGVLHSAVPGGPGDPIEVRLGAPSTRAQTPYGVADPQGQEVPLAIEISNNSNADVVIEQISVVQETQNPWFRIDSIFRKVKELIEPAQEKTFELPARGRLARELRDGERNVLELKVIVELQSGDSYYYEFSVPVAVPMRMR